VPASTSTFAACSRAPERPPDVLLVTFDTTRADRIGCYGHELARTPAVDGLAARGVRFERAWSHFMLEDYVGAMSMLETLRTPWFDDWYWAEADMVRVWSLFLTCKFPTAQAEIEAIG